MIQLVQVARRLPVLIGSIRDFGLLISIFGAAATLELASICAIKSPLMWRFGLRTNERVCSPESHLPVDQQTQTLAAKSPEP